MTSKKAVTTGRPAKRPAAGGRQAKEASRFCPRFHHAVELIGRRWSGAIIMAMMPGSQCFNEILATVPGLSDRLLTERLRELESEGVVRRTVLAGPPVRVSYELTESGRALEPVVEALGHWAEHWVKL